MNTADPAALGQRRSLAILFADLCDSTRISGECEPEQFAALLEALRGVFDTVINRHGGLIVRIDGDGLLCAFGYPEAREDAARRATEAALDLHDAVAALDQSFGLPGVSVRLHSGVHAGTVLVREGDMVRGRIEILGDATNVAARLCDAAGPDEILASEASLAGDRHFFETGGARAVSLAGRGAAIAALQVVGRAGIGTRLGARLRRGAAPFCGRLAEQAALRGALQGAVGGDQQRALIWGEAGIGKSRLLREFLAEAAAAGFAVHQGYCEAYLGARPLQPFAQIAQSLALQGSDDPAGLSEAILGWARDPLAAPTVLAIDDWQWADDASHLLLGELLRLRQRGLLLILAGRPEAISAAQDFDLQAVPLHPLSGEESETVITGLLRSADPFRIERIRDLAGGSPLYIEELCHMQGARLPGDRGSGDAAAWLDALVQARFQRLAPDEAALVQTAAVIGHMVPLGLFCAVTGTAPDAAVLQALQDSDFLHQGELEGTLRFKHALTRDAIYRSIGMHDRRTLHARIAEALEQRAAAGQEAPPVDALAYHHAACGHGAMAIKYAMQAGDQAMAAGALDRAQAQFALALEQLADPGSQQELHRKLIGRFGRASVVDPSLEQLPVLERAATLAKAAGDCEAKLLARYWLGSINYGLGNAAASIAQLERAREMLDPEARPSFSVHLLANLGQSHAIASHYDQARDFLTLAIDRKQAVVRPGEVPAGIAYAYASRAYVDAIQGHFPAAHKGFDAAMATLGGTFHPLISSVQSLRALGLICEHEHAACLPYIREAIEITYLSRARYLVMSCRAVEDYVQWLLSGDGAHVDRLIERTAWLNGSASRQRLSLYFGWLTRIMAETGDSAAAQRYYEAACQRADEGDRLGEGDACRAMAILAARGKAAFEPRHYLDRAYASATLRQAPREQYETDLSAAEVQTLLGNSAAASAAHAQALAGFAALGMTSRIAAISPPVAAVP